LRGKAILAGVLLGLCLPRFLDAQEARVPRFSGRVFVEGRPIDRLVEVRLDSQASSTIATAYTLGSSEFVFVNVALQLNEEYVLVIDEPGFKELSHPLRTRDFSADHNAPGVLIYAGLLVLSLERDPSEEEDDDAGQVDGPPAVDVRQLTAEIPEESRREYDLARDEFARGDDAAARAHLERAIGLAPDYYDALVQLGVGYLRAEQYDEAETMLLRARDLNPNDPIPLTNLGSLYFQQGERLESASAGESGLYERAVEVLEEAVRLNPAASRPNFYLGAALYRVGNYDRAESMLRSALAGDAGLHEARLTLLNVYTRQGRYDAALDEIARYLAADPDTPDRDRLDVLRAEIEGQLER